MIEKHLVISLITYPTVVGTCGQGLSLKVCDGARLHVCRRGREGYGGPGLATKWRDGSEADPGAARPCGVSKGQDVGQHTPQGHAQAYLSPVS